MKPRLYACSTNAGKLREFALAASQVGLVEVTIEPLPGIARIAAPDENGSTFEENAVLKAEYYSGFTAELVFADDSGLEVNGLGGAPGVYSARYAGLSATAAENNRLLLERLGTNPCRSSRFVCVIALAQAGKALQTFRGEVRGEILDAPRGAEGFGYDSLFFYPPFGQSFGEIAPEQKFTVSHRGLALRSMLAFLRTRP